MNPAIEETLKALISHMENQVVNYDQATWRVDLELDYKYKGLDIAYKLMHLVSKENAQIQSEDQKD